MRKVLALVGLVACDGGTPQLMTADAGIDATEMLPPDAPPSIDGTWRDTFHTVAGPVTVSSCTTPPVAVKVDATTAVSTTYTGVCMDDGTFRIKAPDNLGTYYLRVAGTLYETTKRTGIDLSTDRLGRNGVAAITGTTLALDLTGLQSWSTGDLVVAFAPNIGYRQTLSFTTGAPAPGQTLLDATANWSGYKLDAAESDALQIAQLGQHTTAGALAYVSLDRVLDVPAFTMMNNTEHEITGAMTAPPARSLDLAINVASFNQFAQSAVPSFTLRSIQGSVFAAVSTDVIESPALVSFAQSSESIAVLDFGTVPYGDPFPSAWERLVKIQVGYTVPYTWNSITGTLNALVVRVMSKATAEAGTIDARLGPPTSLQLDDEDAQAATVISLVPVVSWSPPSLGTPTDYEVQVYEAKSNGVSLTFTSVLRLVTKATSLRIPDGHLLGQRQYVFVVRARARDGVDVYETPLRAGTAWSSADAMSALVTTSI